MYFEADFKWKRKIAVRDGATSKILIDEIAAFLHGRGLRDVQRIGPSVPPPQRPIPSRSVRRGCSGTISVESSGEPVIISFVVHVCDIFTGVYYFVRDLLGSSMLLIAIVSVLVLLGSHIDLWMRFVVVAILVILRGFATRPALYLTMTGAVNILTRRLRKSHAHHLGT